MKNLFIITLTNSLGFYIASTLFPAISLSSIIAALWAGFLLAIISLFLKPLLLLISLPINCITFGFFTLVINTWLIQLSAYLTEGLSIPTFKFALIPAIIIYLLNRVRLTIIQNKT
ncbi:phage holin family protein [Desulforamulus aquiferis]|uniref:Phage holin family protein n=1 Tax=Desulforamulus aquiferis TaxID=1397668 RepID=A0AAW7ZC24_9FIRM|nr:phage holin family protein [Desulforamulus aquiferis]MDO7786774.1 phage holin family protein [Desulforamulus aquiferis]